MRRLGEIIALIGIMVAAIVAPVWAATGDPVPAALGTGPMLVMVEGPDCPYCRKWEREVGPGYRASDEGHVAPLVKRMKGHPDLQGIGGIAYTPTFILVDHGAEIGRIIGYAGADFFWGEIGRLIKQIDLHLPAPEERAALPHDPARRAVR